jgi:glyoxylase-like metal-dependent hydrolase (beta-lactamase superfamily II)
MSPHRSLLEPCMKFIPASIVLGTFSLLVGSAAGAQASAAGPVAHSPAPHSPAAQANDLLRSLRASHGSVTTPMSVQYGGTYVLEGHLRKPHDTSEYNVLVTLTLRDNIVSWDSRMGAPGVPPASMTDRDIGVVTAAGVWSKGTKGWRPQSPGNGAAYAHTLGVFSPVALLAQATGAVADAADANRIELAMPRGERAIATLDPNTKTVAGIEWPRAHPRLGDVSDVVEFSGFEGRQGVLFPKEIAATAHEDGASYKMKLTLLPGPTAADIATLEEAGSLVPATPPVAEVKSSQLGPGLWAFTHSVADSRCVVMETGNGLLAFEAPVSSEVCEQIVDAIHAKFPGKPLKGLAMSHYHPHYTGGVRAFVAAGCDLYATPEMEAFLKTVLARPFARKPDRLQQSPREPVFHTVRGRLDVADSSSAVTMIDIGLRSQHTDEYTVFYFPKAKVLFQGDLGYVAPKGTLRVFPRGVGLDGALQPYNLDIATLVQSWPATDTPPLDWPVFVQAADKLARP